MKYCKGKVLTALILTLLLAIGICAGRDKPTDADRVWIKLEGQPVAIILTIPDGFCGIAWGTPPDNTGWRQTLQREERLPSGIVYSAQYQAVVDATDLLGDIRQDKQADIYYHYNKKTEVLGVSLAALHFSGEDSVRQVKTVLMQQYGEPSAVQEVHQDSESRLEYCWYGKQTSIRFAPASDRLKATVVVFATKDLDI